jgi:aspartate/methionine/tyrosine aminotransferase
MIARQPEIPAGQGRHLIWSERPYPLHPDTLSDITQEQEVESRFSPSLIRAVANTAMGRQDVLPFWFGESDQSTPPFIREAAIASLREGETFYSENLGRPYLRQAISTYLTDLHQLPIGTDRIAVTTSGVSALMLASQLLVAPGDRVVTVTPLWPNAVEIPKVMSGRVTCVSLEVQNGRWTLPLEKLLDALTPGTRMLVLNSPNNPTGWTIRRAEQLAILEHCRRRGIWIISDDVYERLVYADGMKTAPSFLTLAAPGDRLIVINSFSKAWSMTGWRLGWMVVPSTLLAELASLLEYNTSCVSEFIQRAGATALEQGEPYVGQLRAQLATTKAKLFAALSSLPRLEVPEADGAMYLFLRVAGEDDSVHLAKRLIEEVGLGLAPGRAFGPEGEGWLRWCYAADTKKIESGIERLVHFLSR